MLPAVELNALKFSIQRSMINLSKVLRKVREDVKSQSDFKIWFRNEVSNWHILTLVGFFSPSILYFQIELGKNFNPQLSSVDLHDLGQAGLILQDCFFPEIVKSTMIEMEWLMCLSNSHYTSQMLSVLGHISRLVADFKSWTKADNRISPGVTCTIIDAVCLEIKYPSTRSDVSNNNFNYS